MQYIKISKNLKKDLAPREFILYGMIAAYLSIPNFEATHGGFKKMIYTRTRDGRFKLDNAWRALQDKGYLKMLRFPIGENKFYYRYELRSTPDLSVDAKRNFGISEGRRYLDNAGALYTEPSKNYYIISRDVLLDPNLSFTEKWMWIIIRDQLDLHNKDILKDKNGETLDFVRKDTLRSAAGLRQGKFDRHWHNLKEQGYLHAARFYDAENGVTRAEYSLSSAPFKTPCAASQTAKKPVVKPAAPAVLETTPEIPRDPRTVKAIIKQNIGYDMLVPQTRLIYDNGFSFSKERLDAIVELMVSMFCTKQKTVRINCENVAADLVRERIMALDCEHIVNGVLYKLWEYGEEDVQNVRAYRKTVIYNALESV